jgi:hypothetical protein
VSVPGFAPLPARPATNAAPLASLPVPPPPNAQKAAQRTPCASCGGPVDEPKVKTCRACHERAFAAARTCVCCGKWKEARQFKLGKAKGGRRYRARICNACYAQRERDRLRKAGKQPRHEEWEPWPREKLNRWRATVHNLPPVDAEGHVQYPRAVYVPPATMAEAERLARRGA